MTDWFCAKAKDAIEEIERLTKKLLNDLESNERLLFIYIRYRD